MTATLVVLKLCPVDDKLLNKHSVGGDVMGPLCVVYKQMLLNRESQR